jgi:hypothetical protein
MFQFIKKIFSKKNQKRQSFRRVVDQLEPRKLMSTTTLNIFNDANANGVRDAGEAPLPMVRAELVAIYGYPIPEDVGISAANGRLDLQFPFTSGPLQIDIKLRDNERVTTGNEVIFYTVFSTSDNRAIDVGVHVEDSETIPKRTLITGSVFEDTNRNGRMDDGEVPKGRRYVYLRKISSDGSSQVIGGATTNEDGTYAIATFETGTMVVESRDMSGEQSSGPQYFTVFNSGEQRIVDLAKERIPFQSNRLAGVLTHSWAGNGNPYPGPFPSSDRRVFADLNQNGVVDPNEPETRTDNAGRWELRDVPLGPVAIQFLHWGYLDSEPIYLTVFDGMDRNDLKYNGSV